MKDFGGSKGIPNWSQHRSMMAFQQNKSSLKTNFKTAQAVPQIHPQKEEYTGSVSTTSIRSCYEEGKRISETLCSDFKRMHNVQIRTFKIMKTEVTVGQYEMCVNSSACDTPIHKNYLCNWGQKGRKDHPINCLTWHQARNFAKWVGGDLPTEAQWERAACAGKARSSMRRRASARPWD